MAITINQTPQAYTTAGNPLVFAFSSDQTAQVNFSFVVEVYVNTILHSTHQVFRQFNTSSKIDVAEIIKPNLTSTLSPDGTLAQQYDEATDQFNIKVFEKYGATPTLQASATSSTIYAFNGAFRHTDWISFDYTDYMVTTEVNKVFKFLTNVPRERAHFCGIDEKKYLGVMYKDGTLPSPNQFRISFSLFDASGGAVASATHNVTGITLQALVFLDVSPATIISQTSLTSGNFDSSAYYNVSVRSLGSGAHSGGTEDFKITIDKECKRYETRRLHWLNKFGVWDSFTFSLLSQESSDVVTHEYQRESGVWSGTSYTYPLYQGERMSFNKTSTDSMILNSDYIHESLQNWLVKSLYESPLVYLEQASGYEPVIVSNANYVLKQRKKDGLIQEAVEIKRTYTYQSQIV
jgi:hypothetical protein